MTCSHAAIRDESLPSPAHVAVHIRVRLPNMAREQALVDKAREACLQRKLTMPVTELFGLRSADWSDAGA
jgi:hypothetical protein